MTDSNEGYIGWKNWGGEEFGRYSSALGRYFAAETGICAGSGIRVLEIGFGNGAFIGWAHDSGIEAFGIELNPVLVARAAALLGPKRAYSSAGDAELLQRAGGFSHIVAFDVIEHVAQDELTNFFRQIRELLMPDGQFIARFPNGDSPFGRIYQHGDPTHVTTIGREKLRFMAQAAGLEVVAIRAPSLPLTGGTPTQALKRALLRIGRGIVERVVGFLYFGGRVIPLDPNYVAIIKRSTT